MKDFNRMSEAELTAVLAFTQALAGRAAFASGRSVGDLYEPDEADIAEAVKISPNVAEAYKQMGLVP